MIMSTCIGSAVPPVFEGSDSEPGAIEKLHELNRYYRKHRWPAEYSNTRHELLCGDARDLKQLQDESVHLIVTSPPYWTLKEYPALLTRVARDYDNRFGGHPA